MEFNRLTVNYNSLTLPNRLTRMPLCIILLYMSIKFHTFHEISESNPIRKRGTIMIRHLSKATRPAILITLVASAVILFTNTGLAFDEVNTTFFGVAIKGYDTVAYHTEGRAVKGKSKFSHKWNDAKWYFSSAENKDLFAADPERYAPQYGGY
jgi:YHS domain-containing protein